MPIVFNKVPKLAIYLYVVGFFIIAASLIIFFYFPSLISQVTLLQSFIIGALIVVIGSVVNTIYQFKPKDKSTNLKD